MKFELGYVTDRGLKREVNEDSILVNEQAGLFAVCDGVGGRVGGQKASRLAVSTLNSVINSSEREGEGLEAEIAVVQQAIYQAHAAIRSEQRKMPELKRMATTVALLHIWRRYAVVAHVGDCRVYLLRGEGLQRLTRDHSLVQQQIDRGDLTNEEAETSPERNVITRSLGVGEQLGALDVHVLPLYDGDVFMLGSDGITAYVSEGDLFAMLLEDHTDPQDACEQFKEQAYEGGAHDNLSCVVVRVGEDDEEDSLSTIPTMSTPVTD